MVAISAEDIAILVTAVFMDIGRTESTCRGVITDTILGDTDTFAHIFDLIYLLLRGDHWWNKYFCSNGQ